MPSRYKRILMRFSTSLVLAVLVLYATMANVLVESLLFPRTARAADDTTPPTVAITAPAANTAVSGTVTISIDASDDVGISTLSLKLDETTIAADISGPPYTYDWGSTSVADGNYSLIASASDAASNIGTSEAVPITIDNVPDDVTGPTVSVTAPTNDQVVSGTVTIAAEASDPSGIADLQFLLDGSALGSLLTTTPYTYSWDTTLYAGGSHVIVARARDVAGNSTTSADVSVVVDNETTPPAEPQPDTSPPVAKITQPLGGQSLTGIVDVTANATDDIGLASLQFSINSEPFGSILTAEPFIQSWDTDPLPNGCYRLSAVVFDQAGNRNQAPDVLVVVNHHPLPVPVPGDDSLRSNVTNINIGVFQNCTSTSANSGYNTANGHDSPTPTAIGTGPATAGTDLPSVVNTNVTMTDIPPGSGDGDTTIDLTVDNNNQAALGNQAQGVATTGNNTSNGNRYTNIDTGDASVFTNILNTVNTNIVDSMFSNISDTIVDVLEGNFNFLALLINFINSLNQHRGDTKLNLTVNNQSQGVIENTVDVLASTGENTTNNNRYATVNTGDINVATNIVNLLNTNIIDSNWLFSTINVLGTFIGDIILPGDGVLDSLYGDHVSSLTINNDNQAMVVNSIDVNGVTGENDATQNRDGSKINTGDVSIKTSVLNTVNTNIVGMNFFSFLPHIFGTWEGGVIGTGGSPWDTYHTGDEDGNVIVSNSNDAIIHNDITIDAYTGRNVAAGNRAAYINTGDINVATNLFNVANTNLVGSNWFFGHFNVFGTWRGNIVYAYPDLAIANSQPSTTAKPGDEITYTLHYQNIGLAPAKNVQIVDTLPANTTFVSASDNGQEESGQVVWDLGYLASQDPIGQVSFTVRVDSPLPVGDTYLDNSVNISTTTPEPVTDNNISGSRITVTVAPPPKPPPPPPPSPKLQIRKWNSSKGSILPGQKVTFYVDVKNAGNVTLKNIAVHDQMPGKAIMLYKKDFKRSSLGVGQTMHISYVMTVSKNTAAGTYTNTASVKAAYGSKTIGPVKAASRVTVAAVTVKPPPAPVTKPSKTTPPPSKTLTPPKKSPTGKPTVLGANSPTPSPIKIEHSTDKEVGQGQPVSFFVKLVNTGKELLKKVVLTGKLINGRLAERTSGMILLQVQRNGEAWYVYPKTLTSFFLGRPTDAFNTMRLQGLGISNADLAKIPKAGSSDEGDLGLQKRLSGFILLQVERNGEAWYVYPKNLQRYYLGRPSGAFSIMRNLGLGITNQNLSQVPVDPGSSGTQPDNVVNTAEPLTWDLGEVPSGKGMALNFQLNLAPDSQTGRYITIFTAGGQSLRGGQLAVRYSNRLFRINPSSLAPRPGSETASAQRWSINQRGGLSFTDQSGRPISAWQYARGNFDQLIALLKQSRDSVDRQLVTDYVSGLTLVGKRDKYGTLITLQRIQDELRRLPKYRYIFQTSTELTSAQSQ